MTIDQYLHEFGRGQSIQHAAKTTPIHAVPLGLELAFVVLSLELDIVHAQPTTFVEGGKCVKEQSKPCRNEKSAHNR